jgi:hypothetical protein
MTLEGTIPVKTICVNGKALRYSFPNSRINVDGVDIAYDDLVLNPDAGDDSGIYIRKGAVFKYIWAKVGCVALVAQGKHAGTRWQCMTTSKWVKIKDNEKGVNVQEFFETGQHLKTLIKKKKKKKKKEKPGEFHAGDGSRWDEL